MERSSILRASLVIALVLFSGCDENSSSTAPAGGGGIGGLVEQPKSSLGKSAAAGRDASRRIASADAAAGGLADEMAGNASPLTVGGLVWPVSNQWRKQQASGMRAADFVVPGDGGDDGRVLFFQFPPGQGGNVESNLLRYQSMMQDTAGGRPEMIRRVQQIGGSRVTLASMEGTYLDDMGNPGGERTARQDYAMRVAVIEGPKGNVFIRFVGPRALVETNEGQWNAMTQGMRRE